MSPNSNIVKYHLVGLTHLIRQIHMIKPPELTAQTTQIKPDHETEVTTHLSQQPIRLRHVARQVWRAGWSQPITSRANDADPIREMSDPVETNKGTEMSTMRPLNNEKFRKCRKQSRARAVPLRKILLLVTTLGWILTNIRNNCGDNHLVGDNIRWPLFLFFVVLPVFVFLPGRVRSLLKRILKKY